MTSSFPPGTTLEPDHHPFQRQRRRQRNKHHCVSFLNMLSRTTNMPSIYATMLLFLISSTYLLINDKDNNNTSIFMVEAFLWFGNKKKRRQREQEREAQLLIQRLQEQKEARRQLIYLSISAILVTILLLVVGTQFLGFFKKRSQEEDDGLRGNRPNNAPVNVMLIMHAPTANSRNVFDNEEDTSTQGRIMGQQHLRQLLEMSTVNVLRVILVVTSSAEDGNNNTNHNSNHQNHNPTEATTSTSEDETTTTRNDFQSQLQSMGIRTHMIVADTDMEASFPKASSVKPLVVFIATDDFRPMYPTSTTSLKSGGAGDGIVARLFTQCLNWNPSVIYMDPPTFVPLNELKQMKRLLLFHHNQSGVSSSSSNISAGTSTTPTKVYIGYTKHIMEPVVNAIQLSNKINHSHIFFCHNHNYDQSDLPMVLSKYFEGSLKHMAMEELCIFATYFDITVEHIRRFKVNTGKLFTDKLTIWKPGTNVKNPEYLKDYVRCAFKITSVDDISCSIMCDRCGGVTSFVVVKDSQGNEVQKFEYTTSRIVSLSENNSSSNDSSFSYELLKQLKHDIISQIGSSNNNDNKQTNKKLATLDTTIEAMRLAEYCSEKVNVAMKAASGK